MINKSKEASDLGKLFLTLIAVPFLLGFATSIFIDPEEMSAQMWIIDILVESSYVLVVFLFLDKHNTNIIKSLGFHALRPMTIVKIVILSFLVEHVGTFFNLLSQLIVPNIVVQTSVGRLNESFGRTVFITAIMAPLYEEIVFRGVFHNRFKTIVSTFRAVLFSALIFGLIHMNLNQFGYAFVFGIFLALVNEACGSLWGSVLIHVCINGSNMIMLNILNRIALTSGDELLKDVEKLSANVSVKSLLGPAAIRAAVALLISIPLIISIARSENRESQFLDIFVKEEAPDREKSDAEEAAEEPEKVSGFSVPLVIGIMICVGMILAQVK